MEEVKSYVNARNYYIEFLAPERKKVIDELTSLRDEMQAEAQRYTESNIRAAKCGLVGGLCILGGLCAAPLTGGISLELTAIGASIGASSGLSKILLKRMHKKIILKKINYAVITMKEHDKTCSKMNKCLQALKHDIESLQDKIEEMERLKPNVKNNLILTDQQIGSIIENPENFDFEIFRSEINLLDNVLLSAAMGDTTFSIDAFGTLGALTMLSDLENFAMGIDDLSDLVKGRLCTEAHQLDGVIKDMQRQNDAWRRLFRTHYPF